MYPETKPASSLLEADTLPLSYCKGLGTIVQYHFSQDTKSNLYCDVLYHGVEIFPIDERARYFFER